jgi:DNA transformation protein
MKGTRHDGFVEHVCDLLGPLGEVRPKAMFGGHGIYVDDVFCAIVASDTLYFKVDDGNRADYEARGYGPFKPFADQATVMSYYEVPAEVIDDRDAIVGWARKALEAASRSSSRKQPTRSATRRRETINSRAPPRKTRTGQRFRE